MILDVCEEEMKEDLFTIRTSLDAFIDLDRLLVISMEYFEVFSLDFLTLSCHHERRLERDHFFDETREEETWLL